jgi:polyhydroxybutyrate depolymerase
VLAFAALLAAPFDSRVTAYDVNGVRRQAIVYFGSGPAPKAGRPLVLVFHGHHGSMAQAVRSFGVHEMWPEATVVYPDGLPVASRFDPEGKGQGWQINPRDSDGRDLAFVDRILAATKGYDPKRVYAMGHSNGGRMTYLLWAMRGERFAAYGPSGSPATGLLARMRPASALVTAGETDEIIPYQGQARTIEALARLDGADLAAAKPKGFVRVAKGKNGLELGTYVHPGGHRYPRDAAEATVALFKRVARS